GGSKMHQLPIKPEYITEARVAEPRRALCDHIEYRLDVCRRAADRLKYFAGCRLILERLLQLAFARLLRLEQPCVLDGNDGLVGEGSHELNMLFLKWLGLSASEGDDADGLVAS